MRRENGARHHLCRSRRGRTLPVPELLTVCFAETPLGCIATNGIRSIDPLVGYRVHIPPGGMTGPASGSGRPGAFSAAIS